MAFDLGKWLRDITGQNKPVIKSTPTTVVKQPTTNWQLERAKEQRANPVAFEQKYPTVKTTPTIDYNNPLTFVKEWGKEWLDTAGRMAKSTVEPIVYKVKESELNKKQDVDKQAFTAGKISPQEYFSRMNQNSQTRNKLVNTLEGGLKDYKDMTSFLRSGAQGIVQSIPKTVGSVTELAGNVGTWLAPKDSGVENFFKGISKTGQDMTTSVDKIATDTFQTKDDNQAIKNLGQSGGELLTDVATGKIVLKSLGFLKYADDATRLQKIAKASSAVQNLISGKYATRVFNETWNNAKQAGKSDTQAGITATGNAAVQAIIERFGGVGKYLDKVGLRGKLTKVVINGIKEFGEEWTQQFTDNIANLTINPPTSILDFTTRLFAGTGSAGMSGLVLGTAVSGGTIDSDTDAYRPTAAEVPGGTPESKLISKLPLTKTLDKVPYVGNVANYEILKSKAYSMPDSDISILERSENGSNYNNLTQQEAARADKVIKDIGGKDNIAKVLGFTIERRSNGANKYVDLNAPSIIDNINKRGIGMSIQDVNNNHTQLAQTLDSTPPGQKAEVVQQMIENQKAKTAAIESALIEGKNLNEGDIVDYLGDDYKFVKNYGVDGNSRIIEDKYGRQLKVQPEQIKKVSNAPTGVESYGMSHRPTESGANASDISQNGEFIPADVYQHPEYYFDFSNNSDYGVSTKESWNAIKNVKGNPEADITIYRASPSNELNRGDWISPSKKYAELHAKDNMKVNSFKVKAKDIQFAGDDINEFGYYPTNETTVSIKTPPKDGGYVDPNAAIDDITRGARNLKNDLLGKNKTTVTVNPVTPTPQVSKTEAPAISKPFAPLSQPIDNIPAIAKQVTASQKAVASNIAPNTKAAPVVKPPKSQSKLNKKSQSSTTIIPENQTKLNNTNADLESVKSGLQTKADSLERLVYGDTTADIVGGDKTAGKYVETVRKGKEAYNKAIEKGMSSENNIARRITRGIRTLFGSAGDTATRITKKGEFRGGIDESVNLANDFNEMGKTMLPDTASQERVWAVLDPELAGKTISESSLTSQEKTALQAIRQASDLINDTNFSMGKISHETWLAGKDGKYLTRAYEEFDVPTELKDSQAFKAGKGKLETGGYMQRKDVDTWKQENAIKDPFYLASKRIQSTMRNKSITDYANWVNKNADMVSDTPKKGYTQLSDSSMWGELSGKNVRHDVLTDMKGFYSDSKALQGIYDGLNAYDRFKPRQILKMTKTVLNPATRLGNQTSNRVFAALNGINIAKFEWNMHKFAPQELANNGKYARMLRKEGILGTDMTKYELSKTLIKDGVDQGEISKLLDKTKSSYGTADDKAKLSAFKYWLDKGKTTDEAITKVRNGFQDYSKVGLLYDVGAKVPFVGKPFIRFQSELARIIKNSATENPLSLATVVGSIALMGTLASKASGESEEDKKTREGRFGTPVIPFTQIPLVFQTPIGEINVGRMFGMYETAGADTVNKNLIQRASKYLPFDIPTSKDELVKMFGNDVLLGGIANQITDTDFRGKSITDQDSNKYQPSTLTDTEKNINRASAAYHNYQIPFINDIENVGRSILGLKDQYGKTKTPGQAISKLTGFKVEQFGPKQAEEQRAKDAVYAEYDRTDAKKQINSVIKDQAEGKIDAATAQKRIDGLNKKSGVNTSTLESDGKVFANPNGGFSYLDDNGSLQTEKTKELADLEISKSAFKKSDKNIQIVGDNVLRKNKNGEVQVTSKDEYDYDIGTAKLSSLKSADDVDGWIEQANKQLELLGKQYTDPNADELDKIDIQNKVDTLIENITKYKSYGGFTKPKSTEAKDKASIAKILAIASSARSTSSDTYANLNKLLQGTRSYTKPSVQKVALKTITVKK